MKYKTSNRLNAKEKMRKFSMQNPFAKDYVCEICGDIARGMSACRPLCFEHLTGIPKINITEKEVKNNGN